MLEENHATVGKEVFRTCNVLPFSCTHLALWRGKEEGLKLWLFIWEERNLDFTKGVSLFQLKSMCSRVHKSPPPFFSKILEKPSIVQKKMIPHINGLGFSLI